MPEPVADGTDTNILHTDTFKRGLGHFYFNAWEMSPEVKANQAEFPYIITTNRELEHGRAWPDRFR